MAIWWSGIKPFPYLLTQRYEITDSLTGMSKGIRIYFKGKHNHQMASSKTTIPQIIHSPMYASQTILISRRDR